MKLAKNTYVDGAWWGPDYGDVDVPASVEAMLLHPSPPPEQAAVEFRSRLLSALTRMVDTDLLPGLAELTDEDRAEAFSMSEDDMVARMVDGDPLIGRPPAPVEVDEANLNPAERIVIGPGRYIERQDLVALLDLIEDVDDTPAEHQAAAAEETPVGAGGAGEGRTATGLIDNPPDPPSGSVDDLLAWVNGGHPGDTPAPGWQDRAQAALTAEQAGPHPRKTLVEPLERALDHDTNEIT